MQNTPGNDSSTQSPLRQAINELAYQKGITFQRPRKIEGCTRTIVTLAEEMDTAVGAFLDAMDAHVDACDTKVFIRAPLVALYTCAGRQIPDQGRKGDAP